jgi:DNA-binding response OmpR family regulator
MARILIVDDDAALAGMVAETLTRLGHSTVGEPDGSRVADLAANFDAILLDLNMPIKSGQEVLAELPPDGPPVIIMTGFRSLIPADSAGRVLAVLHKPFTVDQLAAAVAQATRASG